jgi:metallo-beta-lactamase family protein
MMMHEDGVKMMPVYVDSPLAVNASDVFKRFADTFDDETRTFVRENRHPALDFERLTYIRSVDESKALNSRREPMVIISASGMAETGRILHHLKNNIEDPKNTICIVSWQAPDTLGRRLAERQKQVRIFGEIYNVRAEVSTIGGLSGHAGQDLLMQYALSGNGKARKVFLVHGEERSASILQGKLRDVGIRQVEYPEMHTSAEL